MVFRQFLRGRFSQSAPAQPAFLLAQILLVLAGGWCSMAATTARPALNVSGTVTGLAAGTHVTLSDSVAQDSVTTGNGSFVFPYIDQTTIMR